MEQNKQSAPQNAASEAAVRRQKLPHASVSTQTACAAHACSSAHSTCAARATHASTGAARSAADIPRLLLAI